MHDATVADPVLEFIRADSLAYVVEKVGAARAAGMVALVGDSGWSEPTWQALCEKLGAFKLPQNTAWAAFSSGTSGSPRVVLRTHESWASSFEHLNQLLEATDDDVIYVPGAGASSLSIFTIAYAASLGARVVDEADMADATIFHGTPSLFRATLAKIEAGHESKLRVALIGGDAIDRQTRALAEQHRIRVISYYGASELSFVAIDTDGTGLRPFPAVNIRIVDETLWVQTPYRAIGYLGEGGALHEDPAGWVSVGDLARETDGRLEIFGRADGAIQTAGVTVIPEEVERALTGLPQIDQAVVFGLARPSIGNLLAAVVVFDKDENSATPTSLELKAAVSAVLAEAHRPRVWFVADSLAVTGSGKIARSKIQAAAMAGEFQKID